MEDEAIEDGVLVHFTQTAVDDGDAARPVGSLADLVRLGFSTERLSASIDEFFRAQNPLLPERCLAEVTIIGCVVSAGVDYAGASIEDSSVRFMRPTNDGLHLGVAVRNIASILKFLGI